MVYCDSYMKNINIPCGKYTVIFNAKCDSIYNYKSHISYIRVYIHTYRYASLKDEDTF